MSASAREQRIAIAGILIGAVVASVAILVSIYVPEVRVLFGADPADVSVKKDAALLEFVDLGLSQKFVEEHFGQPRGSVAGKYVTQVGYRTSSYYLVFTYENKTHKVVQFSLLSRKQALRIPISTYHLVPSPVIGSESFAEIGVVGLRYDSFNSSAKIWTYAEAAEGLSNDVAEYVLYYSSDGADYTPGGHDKIHTSIDVPLDRVFEKLDNGTPLSKAERRAADRYRDTYPNGYAKREKFCDALEKDSPIAEIDLINLGPLNL